MRISIKRVIGTVLTVYGALLFILGFYVTGLDAVYRFVTGGFISATGFVILYRGLRRKQNYRY
jgi:hypothetical protein